MRFYVLYGTKKAPLIFIHFTSDMLPQFHENRYKYSRFFHYFWNQKDAFIFLKILCQICYLGYQYNCDKYSLCFLSPHCLPHSLLEPLRKNTYYPTNKRTLILQGSLANKKTLSLLFSATLLFLLLFLSLLWSIMSYPKVYPPLCILHLIHDLRFICIHPLCITHPW